MKGPATAQTGAGEQDGLIKQRYELKKIEKISIRKWVHFLKSYSISTGPFCDK